MRQSCLCEACFNKGHNRDKKSWHISLLNQGTNSNNKDFDSRIFRFISWHGNPSFYLSVLVSNNTRRLFWQLLFRAQTMVIKYSMLHMQISKSNMYALQNYFFYLNINSLFLRRTLLCNCKGDSLASNVIG